MTRRLGLAVSSPLFAVVCVLWLQRAGAPTPPAPVVAPPAGHPSVLLYLIDTLRADHLGAYGYERDTSPNIDALCREAVLFSNAEAQASWTRASVGSLFTGLFPSRHGAVRRSHRLRADVPTLAERLREAGYTTAAFLANPNVLPVFGFDRGFDTVVDVVADQGADHSAALHAAVRAFLDTHPPQPLFLYMHAMDPHHPYRPPAPYAGRFARDAPPSYSKEGIRKRRLALYDGEIAYADAELGSLLERLRSDGLLDTSIFVLLSDHGEEFHDHGESFHGRTLFAEQLHVPLLVRLPRGSGGGRVVREPVRVIDLAPSLYELLGLAPATGIDGTSFVRLLKGGPDAGARPLFAELDLDQHRLVSYRARGDKIIVRQAPAAETLVFDLAVDPREQRDRNASAPDAARRLEADLREIQARLAEQAAPPLEVEIDEALDARLRALGYLD